MEHTRPGVAPLRFFGVILTGSAGVAQALARLHHHLAMNESVFVPPKTPHCLENPDPEPLRTIGIQTGSFLGEDDIVRLAEDFGRWGNPSD